jgi:hypothetical protein
MESQNKKQNTKKSAFSPAFFVMETIMFLATQFMGLWISWKLYSVPEM